MNLLYCKEKNICQTIKIYDIDIVINFFKNFIVLNTGKYFVHCWASLFILSLYTFINGKKKF